MGFTLCFGQFPPKIAQQWRPGYKVGRQDVAFFLKEEPLQSSDNINKDLLQAIELN